MILGGTLLGKFFSQKINKEPELSKEFYNSYAEMFEEAKNRSHNTSNIHLPKHISDLYTDLDFYSYSDNASVIAKDFGKVYVVAFKKETTQIKMVYQPLKNDHFLQYGIYNPDIDYDDSETINSITVSFKQFDGVIEGYFSDVSGDYYIQYHSMNKEDFVLFLYEIITFN